MIIGISNDLVSELKNYLGARKINFDHFSTINGYCQVKIYDTNKTQLLDILAEFSSSKNETYVIILSNNEIMEIHSNYGMVVYNIQNGVCEEIKSNSTGSLSDFIGDVSKNSDEYVESILKEKFENIFYIE